MYAFIRQTGRLLLAAALLAGPAIAADGTAVGVDPDAVARLGGGDRVLVVGADVSLGEQIVTGSSGQVQIVFSDQTRLVVGPGSALMIESYLFNGSTADKFAINALAGSFRFISGNSAKSAYSIKTPTASIAVRGTKFDFNVTRRSTEVLLYEGAVRLCAGNSCQELVSFCDVGVAQSGAARLVTHPDPNHKPLSMEFRYARFQTPLLSQFRVSGAGKCTEPPAQGGSQSLGNTGGGGPVVQTQRPQNDPIIDTPTNTGTQGTNTTNTTGTPVNQNEPTNTTPTTGTTTTTDTTPTGGTNTTAGNPTTAGVDPTGAGTNTNGAGTNTNGGGNTTNGGGGTTVTRNPTFGGGGLVAGPF